MPADTYPHYYLRHRSDGRPFDVAEMVLANVVLPVPFTPLTSYTLELEWYNAGTADVTIPSDYRVVRDIVAGDNLGYTRTYSGTGTHTDYRTDPPTVTDLTGLPIPEEPTPTVEDRIAELEAIIAALLDAP